MSSSSTSSSTDAPASESDSAASDPSSDRSAPSVGDLAQSAFDRITAFETVLIAGGVVLFLALLYQMQVPAREESFLNPPLVGLAGALLLWPLRRQKAARALMLSGGALLLLWTIDKLSRILIPFAGVYLLAYLLNPVMRSLRKRFRLPRWASSLLITGAVVGTLALIILILAPSVADQVDVLSQQLLSGIDGIRSWLAASSVLDTLSSTGLIEKQEALQQIQSLLQRQARRLPEAVEGVASSLGSVLGVLTIAALVPVLLFYALRDYPEIQDSLTGLFPTAGGRRDYLVQAGGIVGQYLRGQLMISSIAAFNVSVALFLFDVPFWLLIGLVAGLLNFIPQLGSIVTMVIGGLLAFLLGGWIKAFIVVAVLIGQGFLEQSVLTPNILSYQVGLHPLLVLFSLLTFGMFLGVFGLLIAVPLTAILVTAYRAYREELTLELGEYGGEPNPSDAGSS
ncbi:MAG: AI-2E family transporter [Bacteroidetes bacterium SW_9_63_38]|nr:MAG: AI-2E family transporter [Bacteroidetes bacterium SW_9_63_38]